MALSGEELGHRIAQARIIAGFTQQQAADYLGISREHLSYLENGRQSMTIPMLHRLSDLYGYTLAWFLDDSRPTNEFADAPEVPTAFDAQDFTPADWERLAWLRCFARNLGNLTALLEPGEEPA
jgi:transcriptional regulator with XRE-family HTH domain